MNPLLIDVVVNFLKEIDPHHLTIFFKTRHATYEVTELESKDLLRYSRLSLDALPRNFGHGPSKGSSHVMKRSDAFSVRVSGLKLIPPTLSGKSTLIMEVAVK